MGSNPGTVRIPKHVDGMTGIASRPGETSRSESRTPDKEPSGTADSRVRGAGYVRRRKVGMNEFKHLAEGIVA